MNKYRIGSDKEFVPENDSIFYDEDTITSISINFLYNAINKETQEEIFFPEDSLSAPDFGSCYVCNANRETGYEVSYKGDSSLPKLPGNPSYTLKYTIGECTKWIDDMPNEISHSEFLDILTTNIDEFCVPDNMPAQELVRYTLEV